MAFRVACPAALEDVACAELWALGTTGVQTLPEEDGRATLLAFFADRPGLAEALRDALPRAAVEAVPVPDVDWVARFREGFRPLDAAGFRIVPTWSAPASMDPRVLVVDPGRAFGTGTHETTRLCLAALAAIAAERVPGRVLDFGAGTGLLAVAAARLGARTVVAVDNDPEATASARRHALLNGVTVHVLQGDGGSALRNAAFDLVLANVTAPLLEARRDEILALVAPGGRLVLSGLLVHDLPAVRARYEGAGSASVRTDGEWASLEIGTRA